jgi:hypothetical protein
MSAATPARLVLVTGPPRSGTTFVSDLISEVPGAYCVHEVAAHLCELAPRMIVDRLLDFAQSGRDRLDKPLQRTFLNWDEPPTTDAPELLGLKEPVTWKSRDAGDADGFGFPPWLDRFVFATGARVVLLIRHPLDIVASSRRRAVETPNWPGFSTVELCDFWRTTLGISTRLQAKGWPLLLLHWEDLMLRPTAVREQLETFLDLTLPPFQGNERSAFYLERLARQVSRERGVEEGASRRLVTDEDRAIVADRLEEAMVRQGYALGPTLAPGGE